MPAGQTALAPAASIACLGCSDRHQPQPQRSGEMDPLLTSTAPNPAKTFKGDIYFLGSLGGIVKYIIEINGLRDF